MDAALDRWTAEINYAQNTKINRADLVRGVLTWALKHRPDWQAK